MRSFQSLRMAAFVGFSIAVLAFSLFSACLQAETAGVYQEELDRLVSPLQNISLGPTSLTVGAQVRDRYEIRNNFDFNDAADNDDAFNLLRVRLNLDWKLHESVRAFVQIQDSEVFGFRSAPLVAADPAVYEDRLDLQQGFLDFKASWGVPLTLRFGRQEFSFGDERLVGAFDWSNVGRTFDAVRLIVEPEKWRFDVFAAEEVIHDRAHPNHPLHNDLFAGIHASTTRWEKRVVEAYVFARNREKVTGEDGLKDDSTSCTMGLRTKATLGENWDYDCEGAFQTGDSGTDDFLAGAVHVGGGYTFKETWAQPRLGAEYNFGSGDSDPADGDRGTFDNLFPTNHKFYGYMDFFSWRNIHNPAVSAILKPAKGLKVKVDYHWFWLAEEKDAWFNAGGAVLRRDVTGNSGSEVGQELDLLVTYDLNTHANLWFGYSHFFAGDFIGNTSATGAQDDADFVYLMLTLGF